MAFTETGTHSVAWVCVGTHVLISHRNQGLAGGVYLKEIAGMQLLDLA